MNVDGLGAGGQMVIVVMLLGKHWVGGNFSCSFQHHYIVFELMHTHLYYTPIACKVVFFDCSG